ncbi:MAG: alkaline phosphatase [Rhodothalassiaceae bacterium]|nr:MAG: alkaline phosphatase [Rhodothalassiaceae bacterium]
MRDDTGARRVWGGRSAALCRDVAAAMLLLVLSIPSVMAQEPGDDPRSADPTWAQGRGQIAERLAATPLTGHARNVILFIGDGMGVSTVTAMRIYAGQQKGLRGEEYELPFERFPFTALVKTYNVNAQVPDSAGTASALYTGIKTDIGVLSIRAGAHGDCAAMQAVPTIVEELEDRGYATGIVTTTRLTHATPAAAYAHAPDRDWEADADMPPAASALGCRDIAAQFAAFSHGDGIDVALGGGRANFLPASRGGRRGDGRDLIAAWRAGGDHRQVVTTAGALAQFAPGPEDQLLGLFSDSHMAFDHDRRAGGLDQPSLAEMTAAAIRLLQARTAGRAHGFFLMVEGGRIDHAHHAGNAFRALDDGRAFAEAVERAMAMVDPADTLVLVTADHSHVFAIAGYPPRGNPILGLVRAIAPDADGHHPIAKAADGRPYTTLGYLNGPGAGRRLPADADDRLVLEPGYRQEAVVPLNSETHSGEDVPLYAIGPGARLARGVMEQNAVYHLMRTALGLDDR